MLELPKYWRSIVVQPLATTITSIKDLCVNPATGRTVSSRLYATVTVKLWFGEIYIIINFESQNYEKIILDLIEQK